MLTLTDCTTGREAFVWTADSPDFFPHLPGFRLTQTHAGLPPVAKGAVPGGVFERSVTVDGCGSVLFYRHGALRLAYAFGLLPDDVRAAPTVQLASVFGHVLTLSEAAGITPDRICRNWFYLDRILDWYGDFNKARDAFFSGLGIAGRFPASTGIGCGNAAGAAVTMGFMAVLGGAWSPVASPCQCPASDYKSSFSRAAEIALPEGRWLSLSGTASIAPDGKTLHPGDPVRQIERTMEAVRAILESRGMGWEHFRRTLVYLKHPDFLSHWQAWLKEHGLPTDFAPVMVADVCRDDLLFEFEGGALLKDGAHA